MKDIIEDEEEHPSGDYCKTAVKNVDENRTVPKDEAPNAQQKQQTSDCNDDRRPPCDVSGRRFVWAHGKSSTPAPSFSS
jgi:hypothetical protein